jgi:hypothetical protein
MPDLEQLAKSRIAPLRLLIQLLEEVSRYPILAESAPLLYHTAEWPDKTPPAGYVKEVNQFSGGDFLKSLIAFWTLQIQCKDNPESSAAKLVRASLWIVREHGVLAALKYIFDLRDAGFIIHDVAAVEAISLLLQSRRKVNDDSELPEFLLKTCPTQPSDWIHTDFRNKFWKGLRSPKRPDLTDDTDLLCDLVTQRIEQARESVDLTAWTVSIARLGAAASIALRVLRRLQADKNLAYAAFASQFDEIAADAGSNFMVGRASPIEREDRLIPSWGLAGAIAAMASQQGKEWHYRVLEERVLVPDALITLYDQHPRELKRVTPPNWRRYSPHLVPLMAQLLLKDEMYGVRPVENGLKLATKCRVKAACRALGEEQSDEAIVVITAFLTQMLSDHEQKLSIAMGAGQIKLCNRYFPSADVDKLRTYIVIDDDRLMDWFGKLYAILGWHDLTADMTKASTLCATATSSEGTAIFDALVKMYPHFPMLRLERAMTLDERGQSNEAWQEMERSLLLDPNQSLAWHSAAIILKNLGQNDDSLLAMAISQTMEDSREATS